MVSNTPRRRTVFNIMFSLWLITPTGIAVARARWTESAQGSTCILSNTHTSQDNVNVTVVTDFAMLILMLIGLLRSRQRKYGIVRYLWVQVGAAMFHRP